MAPIEPDYHRQALTRLRLRNANQKSSNHILLTDKKKREIEQRMLTSDKNRLEELVGERVLECLPKEATAVETAETVRLIKLQHLLIFYLTSWQDSKENEQ